MTGEPIQESERRRYFRLSPEAEVDCSVEGMKVVHVVGLGAGGNGMRLITDGELPGDRAFAVEVADGREEPLRLRARAVWREVHDFDFTSRHVAGVEFLDLGEAERDRLTALLPPPGERDEA